MADVSGPRERLGLNQLLFADSRRNLIALVVVVGLAMFIIPLPTVLLDVFMSFNLVLSILVLLIVLYNKKPTDFSLFPTVLLVLTVFSLVLNVSSTRLILTMGSRFDGRMIRAFSTFVTGSVCFPFWCFSSSFTTRSPLTSASSPRCSSC